MRKIPLVTCERLIKIFPNMRKREDIQKILPLYPSSELAQIAAALMSDGHIDWYTSDGMPRTRKIILYSSNRWECKWFLRVCKDLFSVQGKVVAYNPKYGNYKLQPYKAIINNALLAKILILCGVPAGNKTEKGFLIPYWVMNGTSEIKRQFLRIFFNFEGGAPYRKSKRPCGFQIGLFMNKNPEFLEKGIQFFYQIIRLLNYFGIRCSKIGSGSYASGYAAKKSTIYFTITNHKSLVNFYRHIGFLNPVKQKRLESCVLEISKFHRIKSNSVHELIKEIKKKIGTDNKLAIHINKFTKYKYTKRPIEHFRRNETAVPLEVISALVRDKEDKTILKELPDYVQTLLKVDLNVRAPL